MERKAYKCFYRDPSKPLEEGLYVNFRTEGCKPTYWIHYSFGGASGYDTKELRDLEFKYRGSGNAKEDCPGADPIFTQIYYPFGKEVKRKIPRDEKIFAWHNLCYSPGEGYSHTIYHPSLVKAIMFSQLNFPGKDYRILKNSSSRERIKHIPYIAKIIVKKTSPCDNDGDFYTNGGIIVESAKPTSEYLEEGISQMTKEDLQKVFSFRVNSFSQDFLRLLAKYHHENILSSLKEERNDLHSSSIHSKEKNLRGRKRKVKSEERKRRAFQGNFDRFFAWIDEDIVGLRIQKNFIEECKRNA